MPRKQRPFSTIIFLLGWLADAFQFTAVLAGTVTGGILIAAVTTAGRLRDPLWLAAIDDFQTGAFCGGFIPALVYALWFSANGRPPNESIWFFGIGLCAAIGGGVNLWRKSLRTAGQAKRDFSSPLVGEGGSRRLPDKG
jgi:hypothetical protein